MREYVREENRIDELAETDVLLRIDRPTNPREEYWHNSLNEIREIVKGCNIAGFHCTRLVETEIGEIRKNGLQPLSYDFSLKRIKNIQRLGLMDPITANALIENNKINDPARNGKIAFFHCISTFRNVHCLHRLFRSWGGEALYWCHEDNSDISNVLQNIGTPCIVVGSLHLSEISCWPSMEERIVNIWLDKDKLDAFSQDRDTFIERPVDVVEVITRDDQRFEELTGYSTWGCET